MNIREIPAKSPSRHWRHMLSCVLVVALSACNQGSSSSTDSAAPPGSSGSDVSATPLATQTPAATSTAGPSAAPTSAPTPTPISGAPTAVPTASPQPSATPTPSLAASPHPDTSPTPAASPGPSPTSGGSPSPKPLRTPYPRPTPDPYDPGAPLTSYLHDLSPKLDGVSYESATLEHYRIPTREGSVLDSWVRRPPGIAGQPLILVISPYYGGGDPRANASGDPSSLFGRMLIPYGYAVGFVSVGGTGNSGGCFRDGGSIEREQLYDAVQYLGQQSWSNGKVASIGLSYDGTTSNELFVNPPPELATVVPMQAISDYYRYSFNNGMRRNPQGLFTGYYYVVVGANPAAGLSGGVGATDPQGAVTQLSGEPCPEQLAIQQHGLQSFQSGDKIPEYWDDRDAIKLLRDTPDVVRPPMFYIHGYGDLNVDTLMSVDYLDAVRDTGVPLHIWVGQWGHTFPQDGPNIYDGTAFETDKSCTEREHCRGDFFEQMLLAWFDQWLLGKDTGILDAPMMQTQADDGVWRHETAWPPAAVKMRDLHPSADGSLGTAAGSGEASYVDNDSYTVGKGTTVAFSTAALTEPLRLTGIPRLQVQATADKAKAGLVVTLMEEFADGKRRYVGFGAQSLNHAVDLGHGDPDISGKPIPVNLQLFNFDNVLQPGSKLVLIMGGLIAAQTATNGGSGPNVLPLGQGANVALDLGSATLSLPVNELGVAERLSWLESAAESP